MTYKRFLLAPQALPRFAHQLVRASDVIDILSKSKNWLVIHLLLEKLNKKCKCKACETEHSGVYFGK